MPGGPQAINHQQRLENAFSIARQFMDHYQDQILAIGLYGSLARDLDGPYSDIEMHCVLEGEGVEDSIEWSTGPWKAEVDIYSRDVALKLAAELEESWPYTHGCYVYVKPLHDPWSIFPALSDAVFSHPRDAFQDLIQAVIVGDMYEIVGKVRNADFFDQKVNLPHYADQMAIYGACLAGLDQRRLYTSFTRMFTESLQLPDLPKGYSALCRMVMSGRLLDPDKIVRAIDFYWAGIEEWAEARGLVIEHQLSDLLAQKNVRIG
jgi:kanamycin nucleotidyltransferase